MKKFVKIMTLALIVIVAVTMIGCEKPKTNFEKLCDTVSYMQTGLYVAKNDDFDVKLTSTKQEELFIADGKADAQVELTTLIVVPKNTANLAKTYEYTIAGNDASVSGNLTKSRLGINLSCKISDMSTVGEPKTLTLKEGENEYSFELSNVCSSITDGNGALEVAYNHYQAKIDPALESDAFDRECYVKLLSQETAEGESAYFWYVSFIKDKNDYWAAIVDPTTNSVVSSRESVKNQNQ